MRPISATIDLGALRHNLAVAQRCAPAAHVIAVVKANAYGHGLERAARALRSAAGFGLVELDVAVDLRRAGYGQRIVLLEGFFEPSELPVFAEHGLAAVVHSRHQLGMLKALPPDARLDVMLKLNTGMNRLGLAVEDFESALTALRSHPGVRDITLLTHFANADDERGVAWQLERFERAAAGTNLPRSLANSSASTTTTEGLPCLVTT